MFADDKHSDIVKIAHNAKYRAGLTMNSRDIYAETSKVK